MKWASSQKYYPWNTICWKRGQGLTTNFNSWNFKSRLFTNVLHCKHFPAYGNNDVHVHVHVIIEHYFHKSLINTNTTLTCITLKDYKKTLELKELILTHMYLQMYMFLCIQCTCICGTDVTYISTCTCTVHDLLQTFPVEVIAMLNVLAAHTFLIVSPCKPCIT